jgi:hypothetical protein
LPVCPTQQFWADYQPLPVPVHVAPHVPELQSLPPPPQLPASCALVFFTLTENEVAIAVPFGMHSRATL